MDTDISNAVAVFVTVGLAELGDKSQLLCIALAARHKPVPVLIGAALAFIALNAVAVTLGAALAAWLPMRITAGLAALLFLAFALHAFVYDQVDTPTAAKHSNLPIWLAAAALMLVAELGDKTQLAVAALATRFDPTQVFFAATTALIGVSAAGVWLGSRLLPKLPKRWLNRAAGVLFLAFAVMAGLRALS